MAPILKIKTYVAPRTFTVASLLVLRLDCWSHRGSGQTPTAGDSASSCYHLCCRSFARLVVFNFSKIFKSQYKLKWKLLMAFKTSKLRSLASKVKSLFVAFSLPCQPLLLAHLYSTCCQAYFPTPKPIAITYRRRLSSKWINRHSTTSTNCR